MIIYLVADGEHFLWKVPTRKACVEKLEKLLQRLLHISASRRRFKIALSLSNALERRTVMPAGIESNPVPVHTFTRHKALSGGWIEGTWSRNSLKRVWEGGGKKWPTWGVLLPLRNWLHVRRIKAAQVKDDYSPCLRQRECFWCALFFLWLLFLGRFKLRYISVAAVGAALVYHLGMFS